MLPAADIFIVGAGPAGAACAALLAAAGFSVILAEAKPFPRHKVCGEFVAPQSRAVLARLGVLPTIDSLSGPPITRMVAHPSAGPSLGAALPPSPGGHYPRAIGRDVLDFTLLQKAQAAGATVLQPCHVASITGDPASGFLAQTSRGPFRARIVILAHGLAQKGSLDPSHAGPGPKRTYMCFKAHFAGCDLAHDTIAIGGVRGAYIGLVRSGAGDAPRLYSLAFVTRQDRPGPATPEARLGSILQENPAFARMLTPAARAGAWLSSGPLDPGIRTIYRGGRFFVGNAAGEVHALVGEGITLALRAAGLLADTLIRHGLAAPDAAGEEYAAAWKREFAPRYQAANLFTHLIMRPPLAAVAAHFLEACPPLLDFAILRSGKW